MTISISDLSRGGAGLGKAEDGRIVFVPYTAPGDTVRVRIVQEKKNYSHATLEELLIPSPLRVKPRCEVFGRCGGCQWQHLPYDRQWSTKTAGVQHALKRVGVAAPDLEEMDLFPAETPWSYRNRIQLRGEGDRIGFYEAGTRNLVPANRCEIAREELNQVWEEARSEGKRRDRPYKVELEVRGSKTHMHWNASHAAGGFRQVYDAQNEKMRNWVHSRLTPACGPVLYDLYGGDGNLSHGLASTYSTIHCVDSTAPRGRSEAGIEFHRSRVTPWLIRTAARVGTLSPQPSAAILDPPRDGLGSEFRDISNALHGLGCQNLVLIGCDADTWARDLSRWIERGWTGQRFALFDFFPQTRHVESVVHLTRT